MFAAAVLLATYSKFGPIAQTERVVYTVTFSGKVLERVVKDDRSTAPFARTMLELVDTGAVHSILREHESGGVPQTLISGLRGVTELAHDASWIYWVEPSSGTVTAPAEDAALRRD